MTPEPEVPIGLLAMFVLLIIALALIITFVGCSDPEEPPPRRPHQTHRARKTPPHPRNRQRAAGPP